MPAVECAVVAAPAGTSNVFLQQRRSGCHYEIQRYSSYRLQSRLLLQEWCRYATLLLRLSVMLFKPVKKPLYATLFHPAPAQTANQKRSQQHNIAGKSGSQRIPLHQKHCSMQDASKSLHRHTETTRVQAFCCKCCHQVALVLWSSLLSSSLLLLLAAGAPAVTM